MKNYHADRAKRLLLHYFDLSLDFTPSRDNEAEIEDIVDCIIDAVLYEIKETEK